MAYKSKFLKSLLTTASAMAVLAGGVESAAATQRTTQAGAAVFTGANMSAPVGTGADSVKIVGPGTTSLSYGGALNVLGIDINAKNGLVLTSTNAGSSLGSVTDGASIVPTANSLKLVVTDGTDLTLTGTAGITTVVPNNYSGLGAITLGTAGGGAAILKVVTGAPVTLYSAIDADVAHAAGKGVLTVMSGANAITFEGKIGNGNLLSEINVGGVVANTAGSAIFNQTVNAATITVGTGVNAANTGTAVFNADVTSANAMIVGTAGGGAGTVTLNANINKGIAFGNIAGSSLNLEGDGTKKITGDVLSSVATNNGLINVKAGFGIDGKIGDIGGNLKVNKLDFFVGGKTLTINNSTADQGAFIDNINFAANGILELKNSNAKVDQKIKFATMTFANNAVQGQIDLDTSIGDVNVTIEGAIGDLPNGKILSAINVGPAVATTVGNALIFKPAGGPQSIGAVNLQGSTHVTLDGTAGPGVLNFREFNLAGDNVSNLTITAGNVTVGAIDKAAGLKMGIVGANPERFKSIIFDGDRALGIGENVEFRAMTTTNKAGGNHGSLAFAGNGVFDAAQAVGETMNAITADGLDGTRAVVSQDIKVNGAITAGAGVLAFGGKVTTAAAITNVNAATSVLEFANDVNSGTLVAANAHTGAVRFTNANKATVTVGALVGTTAFNTIEIKGADVSIPGHLNHTGLAGGNFIKFTTQSATPVTLDLANGVNSTIDGVNISHTGIAGVTHVVQAQLAAGIKFGVVGSAGHMVEIRNTADTGITTAASGADNLKYANITNTTAGAGTFVFGLAGGSSVNSLGTAAVPLKTITGTENGTVYGDAYANDVGGHTIANNMTLSYAGVIGGKSSVMLAGVNSTAVLLDGATLSAGTNALAAVPGITAPGAGQGIVQVKGGATLDTDIGTAAARVATTTIGDATTAGKVVKVNSDIYSTNIAIGKSTLNFRDVNNPGIPTRVLNGSTVANGSVLDLGSTNLIIAGGNAAKLALKDTIAINTTINQDGISGGNISFDKSANFDVSNLVKLNVTVTDTNSDIPTDSFTYTLITAPNAVTGGVKPVNVVDAQGTGSLTKWSGYIDAKGNVILTQQNNAAEALDDALAVNGGTDADLTNADVIASSKSVTNFLHRNVTDQAKLAEFVKRATANVATQELGNLVGQVGGTISTRMGDLAGLQGSPVETRVVGSKTTGVSAGDAPAHRFGLWVTPFAGKATQKSNAGAAGYEAGTYGGSFGFDTRANDDMIVGVGASIFNTDIKHKNFKSGDKTKINSALFSIYGMQQVTDYVFVQGIVTFGSSKVKGSEKRVISNTSYANVRSEYTSTSYGGEGYIGANVVMMDNIQVTPMLGFRYTKVTDGSYKETGNTAQLLSVSKKSTDKAEGIVGVRVAGGAFNMGAVNATPEAHAFLSNDFIGKSPSVSMKYDDAPTALNTKAGKPNKTYGNIGFGLNAEQGVMEYGVGYDLTLAKKFVGHQGTLKLRVNF